MKQRPLTTPRSILPPAPVVVERQQVLGGVEQVAGHPEHLGEHVRRAARQRAQRRIRAEQPVGGFVDGAVAAERYDDVVAPCAASRLSSVAWPGASRVDRVELEAAFQRPHHEPARIASETAARVGVDDQQHPPAGARRGDPPRPARRLARAPPAVLALARARARDAHAQGLHRARRAALPRGAPPWRESGASQEGRCAIPRAGVTATLRAT